MRKLMLCLAFLLPLLAVVPSWGDAATPFLEGPNSQVAAVSEGHGYVLAGEDDDGPVFLVMVSSDSMEHIVILAKADKGVVPANLLGRPVIIKAQILKSPEKSGKGEGAEIKILDVRSARK
jgi:hypothetical protein